MNDTCFTFHMLLFIPLCECLDRTDYLQAVLLERVLILSCRKDLFTHLNLNTLIKAPKMAPISLKKPHFHVSFHRSRLARLFSLLWPLAGRGWLPSKHEGESRETHSALQVQRSFDKKSSFAASPVLYGLVFLPL